MTESYDALPVSGEEADYSVAKVRVARHGGPKRHGDTPPAQLEFRDWTSMPALMFPTGVVTVRPVEYLRNWRKAHKVTQAQLAARIGVHATTVSQYELGLILPDLRTFDRLTRQMRVPATRLLSAFIAEKGRHAVTQLHAERVKRRRRA